MHELGITQNIVAIVAEAAAGRKVLRVQIAIGKLSAVDADAIAFCFDICCMEAGLAGAKLEIQHIPGRLKCFHCSAEKDSPTLYGRCHCGSNDLRCISGQELLVREIELE
ncbi:hydrogenase maturation nickel metallochaperone HypA [Zhongshania sp.]|uniref:hydrogenase maturation nickel metallochaperone HypA/HybF n=1 Tax=Zhongshania sp. TaxID=1971902 RepID=UPI0035648D1F